MANPVTINPTLTLAGQAAAFNADNTGLSLTITHVSFGRAHYDPTGEEVALVDPVGSKVPVAGASRPTPYQIRMVSAWREDVGQVAIGEIAFWAGEVLVFVWSQADGTLASYKTDGVTYVLFNDLAFAQVPANSISFVVDPDESVALGALAAHEGAYNAHPQYVLRAKFPDYQGHLWGAVGGTANAITLTLPAIVELTEYITGGRFSFKAVSSNTGATTININGVGAVAVLKTGGVALTAGSIIAGGVYDVYYDGSQFQLTAGAGFASAEATEAEVLQNVEASSSTSWVSVRRLLKALWKKANLESPTFTGDPKAPTPAVTDNDTSIATTAHLRNVLARYGLASSSAFVWVGSIDAINETGVYAVSNGATGTRPKVPGTNTDIVAGQILHMEREAQSAVQYWDSLTGGVDAPAGGKSGLTFKRSRLSGNVWTAWGQIWDSVNTPKQSSTTDVTTGAMLQVGSFGLGIATSTGDVDMNKYLTAGNYITPIAGLLNLPDGWANNRRYNMVVSGATSTGMYLTQTLTAVMTAAGGVPMQAMRSMSGAGEFSAWRIDAPLDSPVFTGDPKAPTPPVTDNDTSLATTAFVRSLMARYGLGAASGENVAANINNIVEGGSYMVTSTTLGTKPIYPSGLGTGAIPNGNILHVERWSGNMATQIWDSLVTTVVPLTFMRTRNNGGVWSEWAQVWTSQNTPKQRTPTDQTSDAMLTVGSFGVGAGILSTEANLNNYVIPGNFITPMAGLTNLPDGWTPSARYVVIVEGFNAQNYLIQRITGGLANGQMPVYARRTMSSSGTWTAWRDEWHSGNTPKQTSQTDVTPGAMLTVGSFGWGSAAVPLSGDMDAIAVSGLYMIGATTTGTKPENAGAVIPNGSLLHIERGSSRMATQFWDSLISSTSPMSFVRTKNSSGVWSSWDLVITEKHLPCRGKVYYRSAGVYQWTVPAGVYKVDVEVYGGGGSGGFGSQDTGSGGGGGGGISKRLCTVTPGSVITVTVGAGGAGTSVVGGSGSSGGGSSFGSFCSAAGGSGGSSGSGAVGGYGAGGDFNATRGSGSPAIRNAPGTYALGGAGGGGESIFATSNSTAPSQPGMGGGGRTSGTSQPGADGAVFITY